MMKDLRQTDNYANYMESIGWIVEENENVYYYIKEFPIIGSYIKFQRPEKINYQYIDVLAVKYRAFQIVVEAKNKYQVSSIKNHGFKISKSPSLPSKTIHIDLKGSEKNLLADMHHKTRYNIKVAIRKGVTIKLSKNINKFSEFWQECASTQRGMFLSQVKQIKNIYQAFSKNAQLVFALHSNELVSGILLLHTDKFSYYMYAASSNKGKKHYAPTLNVWEAIKSSKKKGSKIFDFEGVFDKRFPLKNWKGFTRFKKSFGGKVVKYPGAYVKMRLPI